MIAFFTYMLVLQLIHNYTLWHNPDANPDTHRYHKNSIQLFTYDVHKNNGWGYSNIASLF